MSEKSELYKRLREIHELEKELLKISRDSASAERLMKVIQRLAALQKMAALQETPERRMLQKAQDASEVEPLDQEAAALQPEFSAMLAQLDASDASFADGQAEITELRQSTETALSELAEAVAAL